MKMKKFKRHLKKYWIEYLLLTILTVFTLVFLYPFYLLVVNSFKPTSSIDLSIITIVNNPSSLPSSWNFKYILNYIEVTQYFLTLTVSLIVTILSVGLLSVVSSLVAWMLVRRKSKTSTVIFLTLVAAMLVPFQSIMFPLVRIMDTFSLRNIPGLIFMYIGFGMPFTVFLYHGFLKGVPKDLEEAAYIDGANLWQIYKSVVMPLVAPITVTAAILNAKWIFNDFLLPFLILGTRDGWTTLPLALYKARSAAGGQYGAGYDVIFPGILLNVFPIAIVYFIYQRKIVSGISEGAVK
jgi:raffinose/stachyose/melibiose transport system permease protein